MPNLQSKISNDSNIVVSICCLSYNHAKFIRKALDGFLMQEPPSCMPKDAKLSDWCEILIHDDCSTDGTDAIIREYAAKYPDVIFPLYEEINQYTHGGKGRMDFFNYNRARGTYIATCEADDYWTDPCKLQKQVDFLESNHDYSACWHLVDEVDSNDGFLRHGTAYKLFSEKKEVKGVDIPLDLYFKEWYTQPCTMVFRKSMFDYTWHERYKHYCDIYEIYHLLQAGKGRVLNFTGANYRIHGGGVASSIQNEQICYTELNYADELYGNNPNRYTKKYWREVVLWTLQVLTDRGNEQGLKNVKNRELRLFPFQMLKLLYIFTKRELKPKLRKKWNHFRFQPIRVFCFHQVSDEYNPLTMWKCDWTQTEQFKRNIQHLREQGYQFISLTDAYNKIANDKFRINKYAVLTADDGYKSVLNILPWLEEQKIPITLFVNTKYLDGKSWSAINEEQARKVKPDVDMLREVCPNIYMSKDELFALTSPLISIGMHGHEHIDALAQTESEFRNNAVQCRDVLQAHPRYIPFFAYTWGSHNGTTDKVLKGMKLIPVLVYGNNNYNNSGYIDRLAIDGKKL